MALALYRRHRRDCKAEHAEELRTSEYDERKKGWKRCECPIFISGTLQGKFKRKKSGQWEWKTAKPVAERFETVGNWQGAIPEPARPPELTNTDAAQQRIAIADAIRVFLANREGAKIAPATLRKYRTFTKQLTAFAESRGYVMLDQMTKADIDILYGQMQIGLRTKAKRLGTLRAFFRFTIDREWLKKSPVSNDLKPPVGANRIANKAPFTDEELKRIIETCDRMPDVKWSNWQGSGIWRGEDIKDFIWFMVYTGLRISDVALFHMNRLRGNEVFLRAKKNGGEVFAFLPDWLKDRLQARAGRCGNKPFIVGQSDRLDTVTDMWRRKINSAFALAGVFEERPTPHRFRHTFARILLQRGVQVADVADLLGDTEAVVRAAYNRWVPERQARLTRILQEAFDDKPKPKVVAIR